MNYPIIPYRIFPLGDTAITIDFGNSINERINKEVISRFHYLQEHPLPGMIEVSPAYSSLTIFYNVCEICKLTHGSQTAFEFIKDKLDYFLQQSIHEIEIETEEKLVKIPVCYSPDLAPDIQRLAAQKSLSVEEVIQIHTAKTYKVFMMGFLPGFAYMGEVDERIVIPRKPQPVNVLPGSVGIAGIQTGVYPLASPGGWQIIGRTPMKLFDNERANPVVLKAGERIQFYSISLHEFENL